MIDWSKSALDRFSQGLARRKDFFLADKDVQRAGTHPLGQRSPSWPLRGRLVGCEE
jgi:hypothetical protein